MRICDRCGNNDAVFELRVQDNRYFSDLARKLDNILLWGKLKEEEPFDRVDLCKKCYKEFQSFVKARDEPTA